MSLKADGREVGYGGFQTLQQPVSRPSTDRPQPSHHLGPVGGGQVHAGGLGVFFAGMIALTLSLQRPTPGLIGDFRSGASRSRPSAREDHHAVA